MTRCSSVGALLRVLTLVVTTFFFLPSATNVRGVPLVTGPELRPSSHPIVEDTLQGDRRAELHVFRAARSDRTPVLFFTIACAGLGPLDSAYAPSAAPRVGSAQTPLLLRIRRILRMESDDPPRV